MARHHASEPDPCTDPCRACRATDTTRHTGHVPDAGLVVKCDDPVTCRLRAQAAGIWKNTGRTPR